MQKALAALAMTILSCPQAGAFESDVHFGLTQWLALQAGYTPVQAEAIAIGNNRVDSGDMQFVDLLFVYACLGRDDESARLVSEHHFPTSGTVPGPPEQRAVVPGAGAAHRAAKEVVKAPPNLSGLLLYKLGEALHALQDSWAHQGVPETPQIAHKLFECDPTRAWTHSRVRGGPNSHKADHTMYWSSDTLAMAKATFDVLTQYPRIMDEARSAKNWEQVRPALDGFIMASTKSEKKAWFVSQGIAEVSFLGDTTLKDGTQRFDRRWSQRRLPRLTTVQSRQHQVDADVLDFYSRFFAQWISADDFDALAGSFGAASAQLMKRAADPMVPTDNRELAARLKLWRLRDHGMAAGLAHAPRHLTPKEIATVSALGKVQDAYVRYDLPTDALFPLVTNGKEASPLLPFIVYEAAPSSGLGRRMVATAKFRHAPYDIVGVIAEKIDGQWKVLSIVSAVDH
jgi:Family of unknown function (DUF6765)